MYTTVASYIATILLSMCMDYVSLAWIDSIPHVTKGATTQVIITLHRKSVLPCKCMELHVVASANV